MALLLSPTLRWAQGRFWRNRPAVDRLRYRLHARCRQWRPLLTVLAGVGVVARVVLLVWRLPPALYWGVREEPVRVGTEASTRTGLIAGFAGLAALFSLSYTAAPTGSLVPKRLLGGTSYPVSDGQLQVSYPRTDEGRQ